MKQFLTVMRYEFSTYAKNKMFLGLTLAVVVLIALAIFLPPILDSGNNDPWHLPPDTQATDLTEREIFVSEIELSRHMRSGGRVLIIDQIGVFNHHDFPVNNQSHIYLITGEYVRSNPEMTTFEELNVKVQNGQFLMIYMIYSPRQVVVVEWLNELHLDRNPTAMLHDYFEAAFANYLAARGNNEYAIAVHLNNLNIEEYDANNTEYLWQAHLDETSFLDSYFYTYILLMILYISIVLYGQFVATSVATEKSSRAMEVLITSAKPTNLIFGKIIGTGAAGLTQIVLWIGAILVAFSFNYEYWSNMPMISAIFDMPPSILAYSIGIYIIAFFTFAACYAACGSLVSRVEDTQTASMPVMVVFIAAFFIAITGMATPDTTIVVVGSFIPLISPMVMFVRIAMGTVSAIEIIISFILMIITAGGIAFAASKIYRAGVLMYGQKPSLSAILGAFKGER